MPSKAAPAVCADINECLTVNKSICHECINLVTQGVKVQTYECKCKDGYVLTNDNKVCQGTISHSNHSHVYTAYDPPSPLSWKHPLLPLSLIHI